MIIVIILILLILVGLILTYLFYPPFDFPGKTLWRGDKNIKQIALTFDDGPSYPYTLMILDILKEKGIKATFFFLGENSKRLKEIVKKTIEENHVIGNHTYSHKKLHFSNLKTIEKEIIEAEKELGYIGKINGKKILRLPHGFKNPFIHNVLNKLNYVLIAWTKGVWDTAKPGVNKIISRSISAQQNGLILLLHDGYETSPNPDCSQMVEALPSIIDYYLKEGYEFVTIPQMFSSKE